MEFRGSSRRRLGSIGGVLRPATAVAVTALVGVGLLAQAASGQRDRAGSASAAAAGRVLTPIPGSPFATGGLLPAALAFSPSGHLLVTASGQVGNGTKLSVFRVSRNQTLTAVRTSQPGSNPPIVQFNTGRDVVFSPAGRLLVTLGFINQGPGGVPALNIYGVSSRGRLTLKHQAPLKLNEEAEAISISPNGRWLAVTGGTDDTPGLVSVFPIGKGGQVREAAGSTLKLPRSWLDTAAFSPNSRLLVADDANNARVMVFSVSAKGAVKKAAAASIGSADVGNYASDVQFSPNGKLLAAATPPHISMFSVRAGGSLRKVRGSPFSIKRIHHWIDPNPAMLSFTSGGHVLAAADQDNSTVPMFWVGPHGVLTPLAGSPFHQPHHNGNVLSFSPNGRLLATTGSPSGRGGVSVFSVKLPMRR